MKASAVTLDSSRLVKLVRKTCGLTADHSPRPQPNNPAPSVSQAAVWRRGSSSGLRPTFQEASPALDVSSSAQPSAGARNGHSGVRRKRVIEDLLKEIKKEGICHLSLLPSTSQHLHSGFVRGINGSTVPLSQVAKVTDFKRLLFNA